MEENPIQENKELNPMLTISLHSFADLTDISPVVFLYLLKECYTHGTCKATAKFRVLQQRVSLVLFNSPNPGPATFIVQCLYVLPLFGLYSEGFSHLVISAFCRFRKLASFEDTSSAKGLASQFFLDIVAGLVNHDDRIVVKLLQTFDITLIDIENTICDLKVQHGSRLETAKAVVEEYIFNLVESESYMSAVELLEHFSIRQSGELFLLKMMQNKHTRAAEKWATFMGKPMLCVLVREYVSRKMLKHAYETINKNNLKEEFPEVYRQVKESSLKKFAEKALWDLAEAKTKGDKQFLEYLVYLAMEAGYSEKVDELCDRYSLEGFVKAKGGVRNLYGVLAKLTEMSCDDMNFEIFISPINLRRYLHLKELLADDIVWVDSIDALHNATNHIEDCKVVGLDCEWKPNYIKGSKPNKVSIMQIASDKMVFVIDLIKLSEEVPDTFDNCLSRIFQSPRILKLGYNFQGDMKHLGQSYGELKCFKHCEMLLDIQNVFKGFRGGLSGLAEKILGVGLNKTRRNSDWEQRPLSQNQLEYAALDAVVLVHIFHHFRDQSKSTGAGALKAQEKTEWKSEIISHWGKPKKAKESKKRTKPKVEEDKDR